MIIFQKVSRNVVETECRRSFKNGIKKTKTMNIFLNFIRLIITLIKKLKFEKKRSFAFCGAPRE